MVLGLVVMFRLPLNSANRTIQGQLRTYATQIEQSAVRGTFPHIPRDAASLDRRPDRPGTGADAGRHRAGRHAEPDRTARALHARARLGHAGPATGRGPRRAAQRSVCLRRACYGSAGQPVTIITITGTYLRSQVNQTFARLLAIGVPFLLVLACGTVWLVVGHALRPVEQIRGAVTAITSADLSQRVPEPGTDDEIGRLARTMNDMLARLEDAAARQRRFVADASHSSAAR